VSSSALRGPLFVTAALTVAGCTSALKEPPPIAELGHGRTANGSADVGVPELLRRAELELGRAPDTAAVARSLELFLAAATRDETRAEAFFGALKATAWLIEHEDDGTRRKELAVQGVQIGQWCGRLHPDEIECTYRLALAVGQQARERSSTAVDGLDVMVELLEEVIEQRPDLDRAGGHRVLALVLLRAPGWPSGPGDPELGLEHAEAAIRAFPDYPPNQMVLGEALLENGRSEPARRALERGIELALATGPDAESAEWIAKAEATLAAIR
jgi:hypothetical protein